MSAVAFDVAVSPDVRGTVAPAALSLADVVVREDDAALGIALAEAASTARTATQPADVMAAVRAMYRRVGVDPTKTRPSSEALLRRVRKGDALPRINSAVDVVNWCSLEAQLPFGLYDGATVEGAVVLRLGRPGESYAGIRKDNVHLEGRLALVDNVGPFGNPTSDSARTMVTTRTTRLIVVIFGPASLSGSNVQRALDVAGERLLAFCRPST